MKRDSKATRGRSDAAAQAANAVEKLIERLSAEAEAGDASANPQVMADLKALVERVREHYRVLADRQVLAALEAALAVGTDAADPLAPVTAPANADTHDEALNALEALIHARGNEATTAEAGGDVPPEAEAPDQQLFEGTVRLHLFPGGSMQRVLRFVEDIGKRPQFRVLRMSGNPQREGTEIDLGLREPMPLLETLRALGHRVEPEDSHGPGIPAVSVHLYAAEVAQR